MFNKVCVLLLALGLSQAVPHMLLPDVGLMQFMMRSRDLSQDNPTRSLSCFDYYLPQLNNIADNYKTEYAACLTAAKEAEAGIDDTTKENRTRIDNASDDACKALTTCSALSGSIAYFECYAEAGGDNAKTMYTISANSSELLAQVREEYRLIEIEQYSCTNKSERAYVENTANTYEELSKCLSGQGIPTNPPPTESTAAPPTESTEAPPTDSTAAPTTESTAAPPTESTAAPPTESTAAPPTESTAAPPTESTAAPPTESTAAPSTESTATPATESTAAPPTEEDMPEEDLHRSAEEQAKIKDILSNLKSWLSRH